MTASAGVAMEINPPKLTVMHLGMTKQEDDVL